MLGWLVRIIMAIAAVITGWFVATDSANFTVIQMAVSLFLMVIFVAIAAFAPTIVNRLRGKSEPED
ncbi:MAG TPA: hypothetical protein VHA10_03645 [Hypericibacter adhaerens]|uniref:hypothetical protein n=1 Tax=Hypericibacter adhaerens TaxID=2602016 RepID=UPI002C508BF7|nr:hypothetical protein [Hypericibacter adhaerens]HWA42279.1 hypothetical protein [Hypericibacter adhaerens]